MSLWTLYIVVPGLTAPILVEGYTSKSWAETAGAEAIAAFHGGHFWATSEPLSQVTVIATGPTKQVIGAPESVWPPETIGTSVGQFTATETSDG